MSDLNDRHLEQLSAYIDGALSERERAALEARLQAEPALRAELDSLRQTVALVRGLPRLSAPRSFALTPEQAGLVERARQLPFYLSSAFSALSAAAAVVLMALGGYLLLDAPARIIPAAAPMLLEVAAAPTVPPPSQRMGITPLPTLAPAKPAEAADAYEANRALPSMMQPPPVDAVSAEAGAPPTPTADPALDPQEVPVPAQALSTAPAAPTPTLLIDSAPFETALMLPLIAAALVAGGLMLLLLAAVTTLARRHRLRRL